MKKLAIGKLVIHDIRNITWCKFHGAQLFSGLLYVCTKNFGWPCALSHLVIHQVNLVLKLLKPNFKHYLVGTAVHPYNIESIFNTIILFR